MERKQLEERILKRIDYANSLLRNMEELPNKQFHLNQGYIHAMHEVMGLIKEMSTEEERQDDETNK